MFNFFNCYYFLLIFKFLIDIIMYKIFSIIDSEVQQMLS